MTQLGFPFSTTVATTVADSLTACVWLPFLSLYLYLWLPLQLLLPLQPSKLCFAVLYCLFWCAKL